MEVHELAIEGWIAANEFVHGLLLAGPNFSQQKLINSLNQDTNFTANGMIKPVDWTKQHNDPKGHLELDSDWECSTAVVGEERQVRAARPSRGQALDVHGRGRAGDRADPHGDSDVRELRAGVELIG